jgi:hypothetical protein
MTADFAVLVALLLHAAPGAHGDGGCTGAVDVDVAVGCVAGTGVRVCTGALACATAALREPATAATESHPEQNLFIDLAPV